MFLSASRPGNRRSSIAVLGLSTVEISTWFWIGCTVATLVTSQQYFYTNGRYGKRQDPDERAAASSFWSGSRYGRSGDSSLVGTSNELGEKEGRIGDIDNLGKELEVSPRIDRFFLGSRYGKRTFSKDRRIDSLKQFETSLDFLISFDHMQTDDKEQMKILTQELKNDKNLVDLRPEEDDSSATEITDMKNRSFSSATGFACLYTGVTNLYRCFHRKVNDTQGSSN